MVVDWNNLPAHFMIDTGNSGWPLDPFYSNFFKLWKEKQLLKISHQDINAASSNIKLTKKSGLK
jgi:acyl-homoserine lactone acylase PvdQ